MSNGSCQCGAIRFEVRGPIQGVGHCHCTICRKIHCTPFSTYAQVSRDDFALLEGAARLRDYESSEAVVRSFCDRCGANVSFRFNGMPDALWLAAGLFEDENDPALRPEHHMFVRSKAAWHEISDALPQYDEYPPMPGEG